MWILIWWLYQKPAVQDLQCFQSMKSIWSKLGIFHANQNIYVSWSTSELRVTLSLWNRFKPSSKIFLLTIPRWYFFCGSFMYFLSCVCYGLCFLFICALWSPAGKGLTSWFSFVVSNCEFVTFPLVSWVRCGTWLYGFFIFAPLLAFTVCQSTYLWKGLKS